MSDSLSPFGTPPLSPSSLILPCTHIPRLCSRFDFESKRRLDPQTINQPDAPPLAPHDSDFHSEADIHLAQSKPSWCFLDSLLSINHLIRRTVREVQRSSLSTVHSPFLRHASLIRRPRCRRIKGRYRGTNRKHRCDVATSSAPAHQACRFFPHASSPFHWLGAIKSFSRTVRLFPSISRPLTSLPLFRSLTTNSTSPTLCTVS